MILDYLLTIKIKKMIRRLIIVISYTVILPSFLCLIGYMAYSIPQLDLTYEYAYKFSTIQWIGYLLLISIPGLLVFGCAFFILCFLICLLTGTINYVIKGNFVVNWEWMSDSFNFFKHIIKSKK